MKFHPIFYLSLALFCVCLDAVAGEALKNNGHECPRGIPASVCNKKIKFFPFPRIGRRQDPNFERISRSFGLIKQPRIGRSDPSISDSSKWIHEYEEPNWDDTNNDSTYRHRANEEKEEGLKNLENYLSAQRRDSNAPWAFFLITPNFQSTDQQQAVDNLISQFEHGSEYAVEE